MNIRGWDDFVLIPPEKKGVKYGVGCGSIQDVKVSSVIEKQTNNFFPIELFGNTLQ